MTESDWPGRAGELVEVLLHGPRAARQLEALRDAVPSGADAIRAWSLLEAQLGLRGAADVAGLVRIRFGEQLHSGAVVGRVAAVLEALAPAVDAALDGGMNDPADPLYRVRDFPGGRVRFAPGGDLFGTLAVKADPRPAGLEQLEPLEAGGMPVLILAGHAAEHSPRPRWYRRSEIVARTAPLVAQQRYDREDEERVRRLELLERQRELAHLEKQAALLRQQLATN